VSPDPGALHDLISDIFYRSFRWYEII